MLVWVLLGSDPQQGRMQLVDFESEFLDIPAEEEERGAGKWGSPKKVCHRASYHHGNWSRCQGAALAVHTECKPLHYFSRGTENWGDHPQIPISTHWLGIAPGLALSPDTSSPRKRAGSRHKKKLISKETRMLVVRSQASVHENGKGWEDMGRAPTGSTRAQEKTACVGLNNRVIIGLQRGTFLRDFQGFLTRVSLSSLELDFA